VRKSGTRIGARDGSTRSGGTSGSREGFIEQLVTTLAKSSAARLAVIVVFMPTM
jgi:hypothetical protein